MFFEMMKLIFLVVLLAFLAGDIHPLVMSPVVQTKTGQVRGKLIELQGAKQGVYEFIGIPYAEPPIGQLRFAKPEAKLPWSGVFNATKLAKSCVQFDNGAPNEIEQSEDCLILNMWVPFGRKSLFLPVYVFIHGGGFIGGNTMNHLYNGTLMSANENIIVVNLQYRLGPLGFSYFGKQRQDTDAPGNVGLWDQLEALRWISENIGAFGGNNNQITLGGERTGISSVMYHLVSPYSGPCFQRAVVQPTLNWSQEGQSQSDAAIVEFTNNLLTRLASLTGLCGNVDKLSTILSKLRCLRSADVRTLVQLSDYGGLHQLVPVIDGDFVPQNLANMLISGDFNHVPLLIAFDLDKEDSKEALTELGPNLSLNDYNEMLEKHGHYKLDNLDPSNATDETPFQNFLPF